MGIDLLVRPTSTEWATPTVETVTRDELSMVTAGSESPGNGGGPGTGG